MGVRGRRRLPFSHFPQPGIQYRHNLVFNHNMKPEYEVMASRLKLLGFQSYKDYLKSDLWEKNKTKFKNCPHMRKHIAKNGWCCEFCLQKGMLSVHHWTYKRLGAEYMYDLSLICTPCHEKIHNWQRPWDSLWRASKLMRRWTKRKIERKPKPPKPIKIKTHKKNGKIVKPKPWKPLFWYRIW